MSSENHSSEQKQESTRRQFFGQAAMALSAESLLPIPAAAKEKPVPKVKGRILGANDRISLGFIGNGMQFLALLQRAFRARKEGRGDFQYTAVCDVWEPRRKNAQEKTSAEKAYGNYHEILQRADIDGVVIAVPDHLHFPIAQEALLAGKDVYLEKPMTYTIEESAKLDRLVSQTARILQVGGTGPSTRLNWKINEYIRSGKMGKILWGLISYNRNTHTGMWDYPIPGVGDEHWPNAEVSEKNLDWKMWLGSARKRPFSAERYFRWRKYWDYSGGNATDLLYHRLGTMSTMLGFEFPTRVTGAGGIYVQKNREVPDLYMTTIEYPGDYAINMISCMANAESAPITIYGNWGTLQVVQDRPPLGSSMGDQTRERPRRPRDRALIKAEREFLASFKEANEGKTEIIIESEPSEDLVDDWLNCMRSRRQPIYDVRKGYQVMTAIKLGVDSYRQGKVMAFDPLSQRILKQPSHRKVYLPKDA